MATYYMYPDGTTSAGTWVPTGAATIHQAIDDIQGAPDDNTTYAQGSAATWDYFICTLAPMIDAIEITSVTAHVRYNNAGGGADQELDFGIRIGATNYLNGSIAVSSSAYANATKAWATNPATSSVWTKAALDDVSIVGGTQDTVPATDSIRITSLYLAIEYQPIPAGISDAREIASLRLRRYRRPLQEASIETGLDKLDLELMDDLSLSHFAWPHAQGLGAGITNWKRALLQLRETDVDLERMVVRLRMRSRRGFLCTHWDSGESRRSSSSTEDGLARLTVGGTLTYLRNSHAWHEDPGSRLVVKMGTNQKPIAYNGMLMENFASNYLQHSSASEGATSVAGLTLAGTGTNGSAIAAEATPTEPLFDAGVSGYAYKFTAGNPHTADLRATWPVTATVPANTQTRFSIDHKDDAATVMQWRLQRAVDSWYWNNTTPAWQAGSVFNSLTTRTTRTRDFSAVINVGGSNTTVTLDVQMPTGGTASRVGRVYHVQLEENAWVTSHVVTTASTYSREIQTYAITNTAGKRPINSTGGTFLCEFIPEWAAADMNTYGGFPAFFDMTYDASNWIRLFYNSGAPSRLDFQIRAAGTTYTATKSWTPGRGTVYKLAARWTSIAGELDLTARTLSVFVDGVKGTDTTRAADPTVANVSMYIGGDSAGNAVNGNIRRILFTQEVLTDSEIARFAP